MRWPHPSKDVQCLVIASIRPLDRARLGPEASKRNHLCRTGCEGTEIVQITFIKRTVAQKRAIADNLNYCEGNNMICSNFYKG